MRTGKTKLLMLLLASVCVPNAITAQGFLKGVKNKITKVANKAENIKKEAEKIIQPITKGQSESFHETERESNDYEVPSTESLDLNANDVLESNGIVYDGSVGVNESEYKKAHVKGGMLLTPDYPYGVRWGSFSDGMAPVFDDGKWYYITLNGEKRLEDLNIDAYERTLPRFENGRTIVKTKAGEGLIVDKDGQIIKNLGKVRSVYGFVNGIAGVFKDAGPNKHEFYLVDGNGAEKFPRTHLKGNLMSIDSPEGAKGMFGTPSEGLIAYLDKNPDTGKYVWGYLDANTGSVAIPAQFDKALEFHNGIAVVQEYIPFALAGFGRWFYINRDGNKVFDFDFRNQPAEFTSKYIATEFDDYSKAILSADGKIIQQAPRTSGIVLNTFDHNNYSIMAPDGDHQYWLVKMVEEEKDGKVEARIQKVKKIKASGFDWVICAPDGMMYIKGLNKLIPFDPLTGTKEFYVSQPYEGEYAVTRWGWVDKNGNYVLRFDVK